MNTDTTLAQQIADLSKKVDNDRASREAARAHIDASLEEMRTLSAAMFQVAAGFWQGQGQGQQTQQGQGQQTQQGQGQQTQQGQGQAPQGGFGIPNPNSSWLASIGLAPPWTAQKVPFTLEEGCAQLATPQPHHSVLEAAQRGLYAMGLRAAYEGGLIEAPRKGMSAGQIIGLAVLGTAALGGVVAAKVALERRRSNAPHNEE